jgi:RNA polymerase-binding transcription factor DksA
MPLDVTRAEPHLAEARERLEHARMSNLAQLHALSEKGQGTEDHLLSEQKTAMEQALKEIEEAVARVEDGTYGTCLGCRKPIPAERLEILPYTRYCVACRRRTV